MRVGLLVLAGLMLASCNLSSMPPPQPPTPTLGNLSCPQIVSMAVQTVDAACGELGRNTACYGNRLVQATFQEGSSPRFSASGDKAELAALQSLTTSPLDEDTQTWGITLLKALVNIPDTLPGQGVTFLLYGDTTLDGTSPTMNAVRLRTGLGALPCPEAPPSAMLIQSPSGTSVTLSLNGATLTLGSTLYITATQNSVLTIATIEGTGIVSAFGTTRVVQPGSQVRLPLGGSDGLQVTGPPSEPEPFDAASIQRAPLQLLERPVTIPAPIVPVTNTPTVLATATIGIPLNPQRPTVIACVPRSDWTASYTVQRGDTLFAIARRFQVSQAELQQGNCITNPNVILPGQVLRVPFATIPAGTVPPTAQPTFTPTTRVTLPPPPPTNTPLSPNEPPLTDKPRQ